MQEVRISKNMAMLLLGASFLPVWRCGLRGNLNFWSWIYYHTTFAPEPQYIPEEKYKEII